MEIMGFVKIVTSRTGNMFEKSDNNSVQALKSLFYGRRGVGGGGVIRLQYIATLFAKG